MVETERLDFTQGSGSQSTDEAYVDEYSEYKGDGRSNAATYFNPSEADKWGIKASDGGRWSYNHLDKINEGHYDSDMHERSRKINILRDANCWCNKVDMNKHETDRVLYFIDNNPLDFGSLDIETIIVALISYVANMSDNGDPERQRFIQQEDEFRQLFEDLEIDYGEFTSARKIIRNKFNDNSL